MTDMPLTPAALDALATAARAALTDAAAREKIETLAAKVGKMLGDGMVEKAKEKRKYTRRKGR